MHHIPRWLFSPSKKKSKRMSSARPRLERRNAAKHFDYDATESSSSSLHTTRSLDLSSELRSFRVEGSDDGELERICRSLGLSGPEDFEIPFTVWEEASRKHSVSDGLPRSKLGEVKGSSPRDVGEGEGVGDLGDGFVGREVDLGRRELDGNGGRELNKVSELGNGFVGREVDLGRGESGETRAGLVVCSGGHSGGIKGDRPPALKPPPGMMIRNVDNEMSTWDLVKRFAPVCDSGSSAGDRIEFNELSKEDGKDLGCSKISEEENVDRGNGGSAKKGELDIVLRMGEMGIASGSCSFTTSVDDDDDSSCTTTEPRSNNISPIEKYERVITNWQKGEILGSGSFGSVYEGYSEDGSFFAVKEVSLADQGSHGRQSILQLEHEIALLSQFQHPNIVHYYGTGKDESKLYIFLELANKGSLANLYRKYTLGDSQVSGYTRQILLGLKYLHDQKVVHRDIKCANLLLDSSGSVKLADFGLAKAVVTDIKSCKGTAFWMAPEVVRGKGMGYGLPADIWSLGCTVLEMLTGHFPYHPLECIQAVFKVGKGEPPEVPEDLSIDARDFILQCLRINPSNRPTAAELLDHAFVRRPFPPSPRIGQ